MIQVPIGDIILDPRLQMRETLDMTAIDEYAESLDKLPPCKAVREGEKIWLTGGWHRYHGHRKKERPTVPCEIREGTFLDALVEACGENEGHGIRRKPEDKRRAISALVLVPEWSGKSDRMVADACHVNCHMVAEVRNQLRAARSCQETTENTEDHGQNGSERNREGSGSENTNSDGKTTGKDGKKRPARKPKILCPSCQTKERKSQDLPKKCPECAALRKPTKTEPKQEQASEPEKLLDKDGKEYPEQALPAIRFASRLKELTSLLDDCKAMVDQISKEPIGLYLDPGGINHRLGECKSLVLSSKPAHVCGYCRGEDLKCKGCKGKGWQTKGGYADSPKGKVI